MDKDLESVQEARRLLQVAHEAFLKFENFTEEQVERILLEISKTAISNAKTLARLAVEETGYGTIEHKTLKNLFCAEDVYRAIRPMKTVGIVSEDKANGSQFFVCIDDCTRKLTKDYNLFGYVIEGVEVAQATQVGDVMLTVVIEERVAVV